MKKFLSLLGLFLVVGTSTVLSGCAAGNPWTSENDHWSGRSVSHSMSNSLLSYQSERDGPYSQHFGNQMESIGLTLRRHLFNSNPDNPFQAEQKSYYKSRHEDPAYLAYVDRIEKESAAGDVQQGVVPFHGEVQPSGQFAASFLRSSINLDKMVDDAH